MSQLVCFWCCIYFTCWLWTVNSAGNVQFKYPNKNAANEVLFRTRGQGMAKAQQMCNKYTLWACNGTLLVTKKSATTTTTTSTTTTTTSTTTTTTPAAIITTTIPEGPTDLVIDEGSTYLGIAESSTDLRIEESSTDLGIEESSTDLRMETFALEPEEHPFNLSVIFIATDIVRRKRSAPRQYPHMALLGYGEYPQIKWLCGASLISEEFVLSAAHCAYVNGNLATYVRLGEQNLDGVTNAEHFKDLPIKQTLVHPEYKPPLLYNDIALFKFERLSSFSSFIRPICLNILNDFNLQKVTAVRWGADEYGEQSHRLLDVELDLQDASRCDRIYRGEKLPKGFNNKTMICAINTSGGRDTCQADLGGPIQYLRNNAGCALSYVQVGFVSFAKGCAFSDTPAIYTRVSHFIPWIEGIVWK